MVKIYTTQKKTAHKTYTSMLKSTLLNQIHKQYYIGVLLSVL